MAWNQPGNGNNNDRDPWKQQGGREQGPPDLDEAVRNLLGKLGLGGKKGGNNQHRSGGGLSGKGFGVIAIIALLVWFLAGIYTVKEAERGVVLRFGQYHNLVESGLHWRPVFIDSVQTVDVSNVRQFQSEGFMLTQDENVVHVELDVQYRIINPRDYLYAVENADRSLAQATDSALRYVVGHTTMDEVLTVGRESVRADTLELLDNIIAPYLLGIQIVDVNLLPARPPEAVKDAFDDAIAAQEDEQRFIREAEAYARQIEPLARGQVRRVLQEAQAYREQTVLKAQGEVARFKELLPQYKAAPVVTRERLYLETLEAIYANTSKVMVDVEGSNNMMYLPLDKILEQQQRSRSEAQSQERAPQQGINSTNPSSQNNNPASTNSNTTRSSDRFNSGRG
ncbi:MULTISPECIES: FtsH protease activity modulator HflK [Idiomarina]|uniref:FtsH protease activity modulator HflK n=1 Tax=Idiomarina TaxID=135575 RepID=UPI00129CBF29|nr:MULTISPECIES: FtsH protease activity modulator HflK [Idiomarina]MRJ42771.1 FtsH protease activity modulator HflK [Idiomarina sp. FeN1]NCU58323.1 FtsH protease activity modulator HflK [Idiomarina sp. FenA--70]NCU61021.1 FtsH protease activity modulator HflK [Idiomarina sp. FenBw--71]UUN12974.1 FtsH protease activity modulator HflK [Idiomarina loihiensis]